MKKNITKALTIALTIILLIVCATSTVAGWRPTILTYTEDLDMQYYHHDDKYCGPETGVSIGRYYRDVYNPQYSLLYSPDSYMFDTLQYYMDPLDTGSASYYDWGDGFISMTIETYGTGEFGYEQNWDINDDDDFWGIVDDIDEGRPVALVGADGFPNAISNDDAGRPWKWPATAGHWVAIRGYSYKEAIILGDVVHFDFRIECTDSLSWGNKLWLDWDDIIAMRSYYGEFKSITIISQE